MKLDIFGLDLLFVKVCAQINNGATFVDNFVTMAEVIESLPFFNRGFWKVKFAIKTDIKEFMAILAKDIERNEPFIGRNPVSFTKI